LTVVQLDVAEAIIAITALLVAMGIPAVLAARRSKLAARVAEESRSNLEAVAEQVRPENGRRLGELVETTARLLEVIDGRLHDVSKRVDAQGRELSEIRKHSRTIEAQLIAQGQGIDDLSSSLDNHLREVGPLPERTGSALADLENLKRSHEGADEGG
jgi:ABC-type transporter Mla subunit MlaD